MNYIDFIIIAIVVIGFILGFKDGLVRKIVGLFGLILGIILAFTFAEDAGKLLAPIFNNEIYLAEIAGGILIFILTVVVFAILKRIVHPLDKVNKFLNQLLGGVAGTLQMVLFLSGILLFLNIFDLPAKDDRNSSLLYFSTYRVIPVTINLFLGADSKAKDFIKEFIEGQELTPELPQADSLTKQII